MERPKRPRRRGKRLGPAGGPPHGQPPLFRRGTLGPGGSLSLDFTFNCPNAVDVQMSHWHVVHMRTQLHAGDGTAGALDAFSASPKTYAVTERAACAVTAESATRIDCTIASPTVGGYHGLEVLVAGSGRPAAVGTRR